jgi:two-component system NtrC family sensor kinase
MIGANKQQALSELALRHVFERSPDAILLLDGGIFIDCNQAAVDMLYAAGKDELLSLSPSDLSPTIQPDGTSSAKRSK